MSNNKVVKSVGFNPKNDHDQELLQHVKEINFSGYVKDLIQADILRRKEERKIVHKSANGGIKIILNGNTAPLS